MTSDEKRRSALESLRDNIETSDLISDRDRDVLLAFDDRLALLRSEYGIHRHEKLLRHLWIVARDSDASVADILNDREAAEDAVRWINREKTNEETNADYRVALRIFGKRVSEDDGVPDCLSWVPSTTSSNYDPKPDSRDMISRAELDDLIDAAQNPRDAALVAAAWDSGCRSGEFRALTVGDVSDHDHGLQLHVDGKTGERSVTLIPSVPHLRLWLNHHPAPDNPDAPLWSRLDAAEELSFRGTQDILERLRRRVDGFSKPVNLTNFRKSRASDLASRGMSQAHLEDRMGWCRGSKAASRYISVFAEQAEREFARMEGVDVSDEPDDEPESPVECPRCGKESPPDEPECVWCGQALSATRAAEKQQARDETRLALEEAISDVDGGLDAEKLLTLLEKLD
jgi:integrase